MSRARVRGKRAQRTASHRMSCGIGIWPRHVEANQGRVTCPHPAQAGRKAIHRMVGRPQDGRAGAGSPPGRPLPLPTWPIVHRPFPCGGMDYQSCRNVTRPCRPRAKCPPPPGGAGADPGEARREGRPRPHLHQRHRARVAEPRHQERRQAGQGAGFSTAELLKGVDA